MNKKKHLILSAGLLTLVLGLIYVLYTGLSLNPKSTPTAILNKKANPFIASWLQGKEHLPSPKEKISLSDFKGVPVILNFWASWCVSCREEARLLEQYWQKAAPLGVKMVGVAVHDTPDAAMEFARYYGKTYILGLDDDGGAGIQYGVTGVPETFFIDRAGYIRHKEAGPLTAKLLDQQIELLTK